jgi:hypothetical protein
MIIFLIKVNMMLPGERTDSLSRARAHTASYDRQTSRLYASHQIVILLKHSPDSLAGYRIKIP